MKISVKNKEEYKAYLNSPRWQAIRKRLYREYDYKCAMCGSPKNLNVHHITYERLGEEKDEDLTVLCQKCHGELHGGSYTFFDDLCMAFNRIYEEIENETDELKKAIAKRQADIVNCAMDMVTDVAVYHKKYFGGTK